MTTTAGDSPMPAVFIGHGSPMNTLERNRYTDAWRAFGKAIPRPRAVLAISAHWFVPVSAITAMPKPRTIHDFYGFPKALFDFQYPAPGDPQLAEEIAHAVQPDHVGLDHDSWGLDHGTWSVLAHVLPDADVPVLQLSINSRRSLDDHLQLGARLAPLRRKGVLIVASGNVVHNLGMMQWHKPDFAYDWARRFDEAARLMLTGKSEDLASLVEHPDYVHAAPTPEHFLPVAYLAGLAGAAGRPAERILDGITFGSISMACFAVGAHALPAKAGGGAAPIPAPANDSNA